MATEKMGQNTLAVMDLMQRLRMWRHGMGGCTRRAVAMHHRVHQPQGLVHAQARQHGHHQSREKSP